MGVTLDVPRLTEVKEGLRSMSVLFTFLIGSEVSLEHLGLGVGLLYNSFYALCHLTLHATAISCMISTVTVTPICGKHFDCFRKEQRDATDTYRHTGPL